MSSTFSIALSGLQAQSEAINTTGNNLANMNTDGFKGSTVDFKDLFNQQIGLSGGFDTGLGVAPPISNQLFSQGAIQTSASPYAAAVQGNGFFVVSGDSNQQMFTRDGNFQLDSSGVLRTETGEAVQGWTTTTSGLSTAGAPSDIMVPTGATLAPVATQNFSITANLDASATAGTASGTFSQPIQAVDSLGNEHTLTATFTRSSTTANTWSYDITIPGGDITGGTAGAQQSLLAAPGTITFNANGSMSTSGGTAPVAVNATNLADGAANLSMNWDMFSSSGAGLLTQYAQSSAVSASSQDGSQAAQLTGVAVQNGGQLIATFSNGQQKVEAQLALASVQNPNTLENVGNNNFVATSATATPAIGLPQTGGRGQILGNALETSNVDMATELTNLIVYQSAYQANSKVITTADQMNQDLLSLIH